MACVFCDRLTSDEPLAEIGTAAAFPDAFPVSLGHSLIIPRRHEADFLALGPDEQHDMWALLPPVTRLITARHSPAGYTLGINVGLAAGQTVPHAHLHVIPRYTGDVKDPRGGVRWVLPERARYWEPR